MALSDIPRVRLGSFPTPCQPTPRLGSLLGTAELWVKRDDLTGFSWGGNKVRTIEYLLADAIQQDADTVVVCGGPTSNFAALMAVACATSGLAVHHISYGSQPSRMPAALAVSLGSGAVVEFTGSQDRASMGAAANAEARQLRIVGKHPYVVPRGGATAVGALGFANAAVELAEQLEQVGFEAVTVVLPVGSGGTIAGLIAGLTVALGPTGQAASLNIDVVGVSVSRPPNELRNAIETMANECASLAGWGHMWPIADRCRWSLVDGRGAGFGASDPRDDAFADQINSRTGLLVDPTYNIKALSWLRESSCRRSGPVVYWHTGGALGVADRFADPHAIRRVPSRAKNH